MKTLKEVAVAAVVASGWLFTLCVVFGIMLKYRLF